MNLNKILAAKLKCYMFRSIKPLQVDDNWGNGLGAKVYLNDESNLTMKLNLIELRMGQIWLRNEREFELLNSSLQFNSQRFV